MESARATSVTSPTASRLAKLNPSDVLPAFGPPPLTPQVMPSATAKPATAGEPMSASSQPVGTTLAWEKVAVALDAVLSPYTASPTLTVRPIGIETAVPSCTQWTPSAEQ